MNHVPPLAAVRKVSRTSSSASTELSGRMRLSPFPQLAWIMMLIGGYGATATGLSGVSPDLNRVALMPGSPGERVSIGSPGATTYKIRNADKRTAVGSAIAGFWSQRGAGDRWRAECLRRTEEEAPSEAGCEAGAADFAGVALAETMLNDLIECVTQLTVAPRVNEVTIVDGCGHARTFDTSGRPQSIRLRSGTAEAKTRWKDDRLIQDIMIGRGVRIALVYAACGDLLLLSGEVSHPAWSAVTFKTRVYDSDRLR